MNDDQHYAEKIQSIFDADDRPINQILADCVNGFQEVIDRMETIKKKTEGRPVPTKGGKK